MGRKRTPGLFKRRDQWHIDKQIAGCRLRESTGTPYLEEAEAYLARRVDEIRRAKVYGITPKRTFKEATVKYLRENQHKVTLKKDAALLVGLMPFIGDLTLDAVHTDALRPYVEARKDQGRKMRTINHGLKVVKRILNLAALEWRDEDNQPWLTTSPRINLLNEWDRSPPYPLDWEEQARLFSALPDHLRQMALFAVNTGVRDQVVCQLRWEWEHFIPEMGFSVFLVPGRLVKNRQDRLIVLNAIARDVVDAARGQHPAYVFCYRGKPVTRMLNTAWMRARKLADLPQVRVHDLKHTFGCRLRAAGVGFEDRQDLLGHKSGRITTHYSAANLQSLLEAANTVCRKPNGPVLTVLRVKDSGSSGKPSPQNPHNGLDEVISEYL